MAIQNPLDDFNPYIPNISLIRENGWEIKKEVKNPVKLSAESRIYVDDIQMERKALEERLVLHCIDDIKHDLMKSGVLNVQFSSPAHAPEEIRCNVELTLMPVDTTKCITQRNVFKVRNVEFSEEEVEKAILKCYPYKLI